jgi:hypothetical protein
VKAAVGRGRVGIFRVFGGGGVRFREERGGLERWICGRWMVQIAFGGRHADRGGRSVGGGFLRCDWLW